MSRPDIVWITLESTRADHCTHHGYRRDTTPRLDSLATEAEADVFEDCHSHAIWTRASTASILTGTYPTHHQTGLETDSRLPDELRTVPELLSDAGYTTGAVSPNPHFSDAVGLNRGFDEFSYLSTSTILDECSLSTVLKYALKMRRHTGGFTTDGSKHPFGYLCTELAKRWVREFASQSDPYFMYLHLPDTHHPYYPPPAFRDKFTDELSMSGREAAERAHELFGDKFDHIAHGCPFSDEDWAVITAMYDTQMWYSDLLMGSFIEAIRAQAGRDTILVVTADHGEFLGEFGLLGHRLLPATPATHVPLVVHSDEWDLSDRVTDPVQHMDVMKTILAHVGADTEQFQGVDLRTEHREYAVTQCGGARSRMALDRYEKHNPDFERERFYESDVTGIRDGSHRYERSDERTALYRLPGDTPVSDAPPDIRNRFEEVYERLQNEVGTSVAQSQRQEEMDEGMQQHLEELGYL